MSRDHNAGQNLDIKIGNNLCKSGTVQILGILMNQNSIHEEIMRRLKLGNACYHLVQNLLSFSLLSKNIKVRYREL
jgi:hypothetical protein